MAEPKSMIELLWESRDDIINKRKDLAGAEEQKIQSKEELKDMECDAILGGQIVGKNEKEREASLRDLTSGKRYELAQDEKAERTAALALECALDARRCLEYCIRVEEVEKI